MLRAAGRLDQLRIPSIRGAVPAIPHLVLLAARLSGPSIANWVARRAASGADRARLFALPSSLLEQRLPLIPSQMADLGRFALDSETVKSYCCRIRTLLGNGNGSFVAMVLVLVPLLGPQLDPRLELPVKVTVPPTTWVQPLLAAEFPVNETSDAGM
jgi:hypothetical protein